MDSGKNKRKVCVVTGTRAEYGLLRPVMDAIRNHPLLQLQLLVTGMHLETAFGHSVSLIEQDGYHIDARVPMTAIEDTGKGMATSVGNGILGITQALSELQPEIIVLLGDRTEVLAAATSALFLNIPIAHIHGGDITRGGTDESVRHAVTKMAHLHFPATAASANNILRMGEDPWRIHTTGAPCLDTILAFTPLDRAELAQKYHLPEAGPFLVLVQHAVSTEPEDAVQQIQATLQALAKFALPTLAIYPNSDAGGKAIIQELEAARHFPWLQLHASLPQRDYLSLLQHCACLIGNSSSGMIESSSFKIPVLNIGIRQEGRERAANVIDVHHNAPGIEIALQKALSPAFKQTLAGLENPYGGGKTGLDIAQILASTELGKKLIQKKLTFG